MMSVPKTAVRFYIGVNAIWFTFPIGFFFSMWRVLSLDYPEDLGFVTLGTAIYDSFVIFGIWVVLAICLNIFLKRVIKFYPHKTSIFLWNKKENAKSWMWTIACFCFVGVYTFIGFSCLAGAIGEPPPRWGYIPLLLSMALFILASLWIRAVLIAQSDSRQS